MTGIYKIQSTINPKRIYIGSAVNTSDRKRKHLESLRRGDHHSIKLQRHFNKYGEEDLIFSVLIGCEKEELIKNEQFFIDSHSPYFNICPTAGSLLGCHWKCSEETKSRVSKAKKGQIPWNKGRTGLYKHTEETKKYLSSIKKGKQNSLGRILSEETKRKIGNANKGNKYCLGRKMSAETKFKIGNRVIKDSTRESIRNAHKGSHASEETKQKMRESKLGIKQSPETIAKRVETFKQKREYRKLEQLIKEYQEKIKQLKDC